MTVRGPRPGGGRDRRPGEGGTSLIEVLAGLALLAIAILPAVHGVTATFRTMYAARDRLAAVALAQGQAEVDEVEGTAGYPAIPACSVPPPFVCQQTVTPLTGFLDANGNVALERVDLAVSVNGVVLARTSVLVYEDGWH